VTVQRRVAYSSRMAGATAEFTIDGRAIACSNVDRVMFPDVGVTKKDLLEYYRDFAGVIVPQLTGRPLTLERFTKGVDKGGFFQKHWQKHFPDWIDRVEMGSKTVVTYPIVNEPAALVYFSNQGSVAFHVGTSRKGSLDRPDQIVFDLDPPDGQFDLARRAARAVHELMDTLELTSFVKTSGSKGLHVVVPSDGTATYEEVATFCKLAGARLCVNHPDLLTTEFYKKDRKGRLYLDTARNGLGATVAAAWSVRGKKGAPISTPLEWAEVDDPALTADGFRVQNIRARLEQVGDPWASFFADRGAITRAVADLGE
jgi:bifunctional non-homologous end joining protein LigD